jgi:hypothetical protein
MSWADPVRLNPYVGMLTTTYNTQDPNVKPYTLVRGTARGFPNPTLQLGPGELITQVGASWDRTAFYIRGMQVGTNRQASVIYPAGTSAIALRNPPKNSCFVGWAGRCGVALDAVWPLWAVFEPASWGASRLEPYQNKI